MVVNLKIDVLYNSSRNKIKYTQNTSTTFIKITRKKYILMLFELNIDILKSYKS